MIVQGILMVPLYLHFIGARLYGLWLATGGVVAWLGIMDLGIAGLIGQRMAACYGRGDRRSAVLYYSNGLFLQLLVSILVVLVAVGVSWYLPVAIRATGPEIPLLRTSTFLSSLALCVTFWINSQQNASAALQRPLVAGMANMIGAVVAPVLIAILLFRHKGLIAIPIGLLVGNFVTLAISWTYVSRLVRRELGNALGLEWIILRDMIRLSPALLMGRMGNALVGRIEPTLIAAFLNPELAVAFSVSKRIPELVQTVLNRILGAVAAGFAHLFASGDRQKAARVCSTLANACLWIGAVMMTAYLATNHGVINLWVGPKQFVGQLVATLLAVSSLVLVFSNGMTYLLAASGDIAVPSALLGGEAIVRVCLMAVLLPVGGVASFPIAVTASAGMFTLIYLRRICRRIDIDIPWRRISAKIGLAVLLIAGGAAVGAAWVGTSWHYLLTFGAVVLVIAVLICVTVDQSARDLFSELRVSIKTLSAKGR